MNVQSTPSCDPAVTGLCEGTQRCCQLPVSEIATSCFTRIAVGLRMSLKRTLESCLVVEGFGGNEKRAALGHKSPDALQAIVWYRASWMQEHEQLSPSQIVIRQIFGDVKRASKALDVLRQHAEHAG